MAHCVYGISAIATQNGIYCLSVISKRDDYDAENDYNDKKLFLYTVFNKWSLLWMEKRIVLTAHKQNKYLETH